MVELALKKSIDDCIALNSKSPYNGETFVYESRKCRYSMTFWKLDPDFGNQIRYYRHQILAYYFGYGRNNLYDEDQYIYIQNVGVLGTSNHFTVSKELPLEYCFERFESAASIKNYENFKSLASFEEKQPDVEMPYATQLLIQCIFRKKIDEIYENGWYKHSFNNYYRMLRTDIEVMGENNPTFNLIKQYIENTHTENHYFYRIKMNYVYVINRHGESDKYQGSLHTKKLLWHGTRTENVASILSRGLKVAPPDSESTGAHFGRGIYFTNSSSKAASYCGARWKRRSYDGILLLCEVALGHMAQCYTSQNMNPLPTGFNSVWGVGHFVPDSNLRKILGSDLEVPCGPIIKGGYNCDTDLANDEFVVYDPRQIKIRYLVHVNFEYEDDYDEYYEDDDDDDDEFYEDDDEYYEDDS